MPPYTDPSDKVNVMEYSPGELLTAIMWIPAVPFTFWFDTAPESRFLTAISTVPIEYWKQASTLDRDG